MATSAWAGFRTTPVSYNAQAVAPRAQAWLVELQLSNPITLLSKLLLFSHRYVCLFTRGLSVLSGQSRYGLVDNELLTTLAQPAAATLAGVPELLLGQDRLPLPSVPGRATFSDYGGGVLRVILSFLPCISLCQCLPLNRALRQDVKEFVSTMIVGDPEAGEAWTGI